MRRAPIVQAVAEGIGAGLDGADGVAPFGIGQAPGPRPVAPCLPGSGTDDPHRGACMTRPAGRFRSAWSASDR
jgi:hypothetical protein